MRSIQSKLSAGLLFSLIIAFSTLWLLVSFSAQFMAKEYIASRLEHDAEMLLSAITLDNGLLSIDETRIDAIYNQPFSGHYFAISSDGHTISSRSLWDHTLEITAINTGDRSRLLLDGPEGQTLLLISSGYEKQGYKLAISVAEDLDPINQNIDQFKYWFTASAAGMLLALVVLQAFILRRSLRPLSKMHTELQSLQQGKLTRLSTDSPTELRPLIDEVNHLLVIMEQQLRRSRDASSDLAHAIKKPLTVIKQITDQKTITDESRSILIKQSDDIYQISDHILKRARLAGHSRTGALFSFSDDLTALTHTLDMMYADKKVRLTTNIKDDIECPVDREDMMELLGNLLDNAYKWAEHKVLLSVDIDSELHIYIEDDGPGTEPDKINDLSTRGVRLDESVHGHGFGLAIASDIINDYHGHISFKQSENLGGFKAEITLPIRQ